MKFQFLSDQQGKVTGVYIPISEWEKIKKQLNDIQQEDIPEWQVNEVRQRYDDYKEHPDIAVDFDTFIEHLESES